MQSPGQALDTVIHLNTYIYDYFLRKENYDLARAFLKTYPCKTTPRAKQNGAMDMDKKDRRPDDLPDPDIPGVAPEDPAFLESWWQCFWDMFFVARGQKTTSMNDLHRQYLVRFSAVFSFAVHTLTPLSVATESSTVCWKWYHACRWPGHWRPI